MRICSIWHFKIEDKLHIIRTGPAITIIETFSYSIRDSLRIKLQNINVIIFKVWYMLGWINYLQGEDYKNNARFYLTKAKKVGIIFSCSN